MARRLADNITNDHLSCPICRDTLTDPRILPCEHSLCLECLTQLIRSSRRFNQFSCPVDRREIKAPSYTISAEEWAKSFPIDDLALLLIQTISGDTKFKTGTPKSGIPCENHPTNYSDFFCFGCNKLACSECAVEHHKSTECDCKLLSKCKEIAREKLREIYDEIDILINYGEDIVSSEFGKNQILVQSRNQIQNTAFKLRKIVQDFEKMALRKFVDILSKANAVADVDQIRQRAENVVGDLKSVRDVVENAKTMTTTTDMLSVLANIPDKLQRYTDSLYSIGVSDEPIELKLELNPSFLKLCQSLVDQSIGMIHVVPADSIDYGETETTICGQRIKFSSSVDSSRAAELSPFMAIKIEPNPEITGPSTRFIDLVLHNHSVIAVDSANSKLMRFRNSVENQFVDECIIPGVYGISTVRDSDDIVITAPGKHPCLFLLSTYKGMSVVAETKTDQPYYNISQIANDRYAVICHTVPSTCQNKRVHFQWACGAKSHIDIINIEGQIFATLSENLLCEPNEFGRPFIMPLKSMCTLPNGNLVVSIDTKDSNFLTCVSQTGRVHWTYTLNDTQEGVCCYDDNIYVFLRESKIIRVLSFEGDLQPNSTFNLSSYSGDGNIIHANNRLLAIADKTDTIRIYERPQTKMNSTAAITNFH